MPLVLYIIIIGRLYKFRIILSEISTSAEFDALTMKVRKCRLPVENDNLLYFKKYSRSSCEYECALERATISCNCKPWNYPRRDNETTPFCNTVGNYCFFEKMKFSETFENCSCEDDCRSISYTILETTLPYDSFVSYCNVFGVERDKSKFVDHSIQVSILKSFFFSGTISTCGNKLVKNLSSVLPLLFITPF